MAYASIIVEGGLFPADLLDGIASGAAVGQRPADFALDGDSARPARLAAATESAFSDARAHWDSYRRRLQASSLSAARITREDWLPKLAELLGYGELNRAQSPLDAGGQPYPIYAAAGAAPDAPPFHIVGCQQPLDRRAPNQRRSPHSLVQEYLNNSDALWGIATNGDKLRLLRNSVRFSRPTYIEFDLAGIMEGNQYAEFALLYRLLHRSRLPADGAPPDQCLLEEYYQQGIESHGRVRDKLRDGVERALLALGRGFLEHPDSQALRNAFAPGGDEQSALTAEGYYRQLLRLVYRLLFLMAAEERGMLLQPAEGSAKLYAIYTDYYSVANLRRRAERHFAADSASDLWHGLRQTFTLFREDAKARAIGLKALNGELFAEDACAHLETAGISNRALLNAVFNLSTFIDDDNASGKRSRRSGVRRRVNYAGIDVEEFGSVYESLLDFHPAVDLHPKPDFRFVSGSERKQTGSYYTPPELVKQLVDSALVPAMRERIDAARATDAKIAALLQMNVCDPASGSGHFVLAAARRIAREVARLRSGEREPPPEAYRSALREVIRNCIYAVDKNPFAVDLCKVALWIEGHEPGLPLTFLDHHIKRGDSLVGVSDLDALYQGIPDDAYKPVSGDDKAAAAGYRRRNRQERNSQLPLTLANAQSPIPDLGEDYAAFAQIAETRPEHVHDKEARYAELRGRATEWYRLKAACDLWTYAFFAPLQAADAATAPTVPTTDAVRKRLLKAREGGELTGIAVDASEQRSYFHWQLEFPDVFANGGFDVVLSNPPWERFKLQEKEFFAERARHIADAPNKAARDRLIQALPHINPTLAVEFDQARRAAEATSLFARASGRFALTGRGDINTYSVFTETARSIMNPAGRAGLIVPSGIATDDTTKAFFADVVNTRALVSLYDFENARIFPGVHRSYKFCLLTLSGADRPTAQSEFAFFLHAPAQLSEPRRRFTLARDDFALFNPNTRTCPIFRTRRDMEIARKMYRRAGVFWREPKHGADEHNPWGVKFQSMFHMSNDSNLFRTRAELEAQGWQLQGNVFVKGDKRCLPLYEAKLFHQYDHRFATFEGVSETQRRRGNARPMSAQHKADADSVVIPRYWVAESEVDKRLDKPESAHTIIRTHARTHARNRQTASQPWRANRYQKDYACDRQADRNSNDDAYVRSRRYGNHNYGWLIVFRNIASPSNQRTAIAAALRISAMNEGAQIIHMQPAQWLHVLRDITNSTNERTLVSDAIPTAGTGHTASLLEYEHTQAIAATLVLANMNSMAFDWATRLSVGGVHMSFFIVRQLPVLPPEAYLEEMLPGLTYAEAIVPRALELTYTSWELQPFAEDLGYGGAPFRWDDARRHRLRCELDAVFAHMYRLDRADLEWILDADAPSESFPTLKNNELKEFGEYRTQRYVLRAYDRIARGELPDIPNSE